MKLLSLPKSTLQRLLLPTCLLLLGMSAPASATDASYNLAGSWNNGSEVISEYQGKLTIFINKRTRGPFLGWYTSGNTIAVSFTDDNGCCTGSITGEGEIIRWSNGTKWVRD